MKRSVNYLVIVLVLVVSALLARGYLNPVKSDPLAALKLDLKVSLDTFWGNDKSQVEVTQTQTADMVQVKVAAGVPPNTRPRQRQWTYALVQFVLSRHAAARPGMNLSLVDLSDGQSISPDPNQATESKARAGGAFADPAYFEAARAEILQRNAQQQVDNILGAGGALVLVDVTAGPVSAAPSAQQAIAEAIPEDRPGRARRPSALDSANEVQERRLVDVTRLEACLVFTPGQPIEKGMESARSSLGIQPGRGDVLRQVVLPLAGSGE
ncbi:hypothetical protein IV102_11245 [bacterium]|nr:hypothetical protein [bacterium]